MFFRKYITAVKQIAHDYFPIMIVAILWLAISLTIAHSFRLIYNVMTILAILAGVINNSILVLLACFVYIKLNNSFSRTLYFLAYFFTILLFYCDTAYFFVTSSHIEKVLFDNLNNYSILGVIYTADKYVVLGILTSFLFFMLLFRLPKKVNKLHASSIGIVILTLFIGFNFLNFATAVAYPKVLLANGFDEESEIEKCRNISRDLIAGSVTFNLVRELGRDAEEHVPASTQLYRVAFSEDEMLLLSELGIEIGEKPVPVPNAFPYEKIVVIVAESFHRDYLHFYNSRIPAEATKFLDSLWANYPHIDHYYTANKPTTQGLNSMFLSQLLYTEDQAFDNNATLFKVLAKNGYETMFLEATSQYYNDEFRAYKKRFGMNIYRAKEDLEKEGYRGSSGWGFHNDVMYEETIRILEKNRDKKLFLVTKTIDSHQPYPYCGLAREDIPAAITKQKDNVYLQGIYWENITLQKFFHDLENRNLLDDKTLVIFTSDHNPHPSQNNHYKRLGEGNFTLTLAPIPLLFVSSNLQPFEQLNSAAFASQIDFAPTLLAILGIPSPLEFSGKNMITVPEERSYAVGFLGETIYYWSKDTQLKTDMYSGKNQNATEKALIHWVQDLYAKYFVGDAVRALQ